MKPKKIAIALLALGALLIPAQGASAAPAPAWQLSVTALPTNFAPGAEGTSLSGPTYLLLATNVGGAPTSGTVTVTDTLPSGLTLDFTPPGCEVLGQTIKCQHPDPVAPGEYILIRLVLNVDLGAGPVVFNEAQIEGGGAAPVSASVSTQISSTPPPFDFLPSFKVPLNAEDGAAATQAGSHPQQLTADLGFPTEKPLKGLGSAGHLRDASIDFPPGLIIDPAATPVLCTEAELTSESQPGCPVASQVGTVDVYTIVGGPEVETSRLFNMVPPPGTAAQLGFNALGVGIFVHLSGGVRSDGDYGITGGSLDNIARTNNPVFGVRVQLWGDPTSPSHDAVRGSCLPLPLGDLCPIEPQDTAFLTMPGRCSAKPDITTGHASSWEEPDVVKEATYQSADLNDNPVSINGCNQLKFEPAIDAKPTTNLTDSPSGLDFTLHQPQDTDLGNLSTAPLKDATVTLPQGMVVNPSQADGLGACSLDQIGYAPKAGEIHFDKVPDTCPDAAKLGSLEVRTPLLAQTDESGTKVQRDPEGKAIPRTLEGEVFLAEPFENPFGSLIAIYLSIDDPKSGTVAKLAGRVIPDPVTGQITTRFEENPQLPLEDVELHLFGGARGPLVTPLSCGTHTTTSDLTPWSTPEGKDASPSDSFQTTGPPGGGTCPSSDAQASNQPSFSAGTIAPQAASYSPFVLKLSREDGSQRLAKIDATLPPGLSGKLAGVGICSEAQIAQAQAKNKPDEGALEKASPSCPASSELGTVNVAAGAGPNPFYAQGKAYLSGPYKGAPLSVAIITPAIAGPFDLGAVLVRTALYVDPESAQIHAVSDPLPQIIEGIPLNVRSIALKMDRPDFTLNPTSCDPMAIAGSSLSSIGQSASLSSPFQVGGCQGLPFKPRLSLRLKGGTKRAGHPKLIASLKAKPGEANIARASVQLPRSAFLDQAHIRTVCTRVQFAADSCPKGSIYGKATAITPLLDYPISGNVHLRSSNNKLPDLVVALRGPAHQPIEIDLVGRTDAVKGALRNTFETVPDAPVSSFRLELFGGKRGLVINSRDLCKRTYKAKVEMDGQNGKVFDTRPVVRSDCGGKGKRGKRGRGGR